MTVTFYPIDTDKNEMGRNIIHYVSLLHPGYGLVGSPITIHTSRVYIMINRDILILYVGFLCSLQIGIFNIFVSGILDSFCKRDGNDV